MPTSKVTSKGQVTVPIEVRRALGIEDGDLLAFEMRADYVVVRRQKSIREVSEEARACTAGTVARFDSDDDAFGSLLAEEGSAPDSTRLLSLRFDADTTR
jgi:AbrB family looped-hinge helix DNA binding protein